MTDVGDWRVPTLTVDPFDGSTIATLTIIKPSDGSTTTPTPTTSDGGNHWVAPGYELVVAGEWYERWTVTGTGAGKERFSVLVAPDQVDALTGALLYATTTDLANYLLAAPPAGARKLLHRATARIDELLKTAVYDVDATGMPTDAAVILALREATCMQAEWMDATGDDGTGLVDQYQTVSILSVSLTRSGSGGAGAGSIRYAPNAVERLKLQALLPGTVYH